MEAEWNVRLVDLPCHSSCHEPHRPLIYSKEEDAVVETVVIVRNKCVDM
jgi:hypothetical protein